MSKLSNHVLEVFLKPCLAVFGEPPTDDANMFLAEYDRQLRGFSAEALASAKDTVIRNHKGPQRWPRPAVCVEAAADAQETIGLKTKAAGDAAKTPYMLRYQAAEKQMHCEIGYRAAREGWCLGLKEFIAEHGRFPRAHEQAGIIANSRFIDRCATGTVHMGVIHDGLLKLAGNILARRERLAMRLIGEPKPDITRRMTGERQE